jgi:hypothetical protein
MKKFIKETVLTAICTFAILSFCAWDVQWIASCHVILRVFFAVWCIAIGVLNRVYLENK